MAGSALTSAMSPRITRPATAALLKQLEHALRLEGTPNQEELMAATQLESGAVEALAASLRGAVIQPGDPAYDDARALYNGMIDKRPRLIARCIDVADVIASVNFGREHGLDTAIRGGGHNGPGLGSVDDGLVIDLSGLRSVRVD